jgi:hypothetical protein
MGEEKPAVGFWTTFPGVLTAIAGLITAVAALVGALVAAGIVEPWFYAGNCPAAHKRIVREAAITSDRAGYPF